MERVQEFKVLLRVDYAHLLRVRRSVVHIIQIVNVKPCWQTLSCPSITDTRTVLEWSDLERSRQIKNFQMFQIIDSQVNSNNYVWRLAFTLGGWHVSFAALNVEVVHRLKITWWVNCSLCLRIGLQTYH